MTRKLHGKEAGPWLGANTVAFGISGAIVPVIEIYTGNIKVQYFSLAACVFLIAMLLAVGPNPERFKPQSMQRNDHNSDDHHEHKAVHYRAEYMIAFMVFCFIGSNVTSTAYLDTYVDDTNVIETTAEAKLVLVLWIAITIGRLIGVQDQRFLTNTSLPLHLSGLCVGGVLSMVLTLSFPKNREALWIGVAFYGLFNGPCVGYCYDWNNRITLPSETSMSIVMFGLNVGASLVPYLTTFVWNHGGGPKSLMWIILLSMLLPLPLLHASRYVSYDSTINPLLKHHYSIIGDKNMAEL